MICGNCKSDHETAAQVKTCYQGVTADESRIGSGTDVGSQHPEALRRAAEAYTSKALDEASRTGEPPTDKQLGFIAKLRQERGIEDATPPTTKVEASRLIDHLFTLPKLAPAPRKIAQPRELDTTQGHLQRGAVHVIDGTYYRVHIAQQSGRPYAVKAVIIREATWSDGKIVAPGKVEWVMAKGVIFNLTADTRATAEQSRAFGHLVGRCCFCSTAIDTPESTTAGYGPVCAQRYGLPWGDTTQEVTAPAGPQHEDPCRCGTYDLCWDFRVEKAVRRQDRRELHRAYND